MMQDVDLIEKTSTPTCARHQKKELLRFLTCGSVDDGKSTLIGRLLHDTKMIYEDQLAAVKRDSERSAHRRRDRPRAADRRPEGRARAGHHHRRRVSLLLDRRRKFIIADTPGHEQYTRNMATGASTCDLAIILIDARHGVHDADPPALVHRVAAGHPARRRRRQQDGPRRLLARTSSSGSRTTTPASSPSSTCATSPSSRCRR